MPRGMLSPAELRASAQNWIVVTTFGLFGSHSRLGLAGAGFDGNDLPVAVLQNEALIVADAVPGGEFALSGLTPQIAHDLHHG
jgi:hypothetical protein